MKTYTEFMTKVQGDVISAVKQIQDSSLAGFHSVRETAAGYMAGNGQASVIEAMPNPTQVIENAFGFTSQILELQKQYALKVAESMAKAAKEDKIEIAHKAAK